MAKRIHLNHSDEVRSRIQVAQIITRLQKVADGTVKAEPTQIKAAEILLRKAMPDLSSIELVGNPDKPISVSMSLTDSEIIKRYQTQTGDKK